jgi:hypothetical protein
VGTWAEKRLERLSRPGAELTLYDLLTGQISLSREAFDGVGGFDISFTREGSFGGEDIDFGYRLVRAGYRVVFGAAAISRQRYVVGPEKHLRQSCESGRSDAELSRKHPERAAALPVLTHVNSPWSRRVLRRLAASALLAPVVLAPLRAIAVRLVRQGRQDR